MATVGTHDVPPAASYLAGDQVTVRARLGLLNQPEQAERASAERELEQWQQALVREGLLEEGPRPDPAAFTLALYGYLARTPAVLLGVSLADAVGETRTQNVPGTSTQYPNWQIPLCDGAGEPVLLDDLPHRPLVRAIAEAVSAIRPVSQEPADAGRAE
jgi:4-alpha-glucanotransferase